eukprot:TRINITY_DN4457_c0_g1_i1.p1 TRINITY_DN4457_c0_g1~~TRINITY_DN4457_c0_g1_i1.p1  ORF type:complete len:197 (-),score=37.13 TRINITY_DN4457_c0_g1_i1:374-964(-)
MSCGLTCLKNYCMTIGTLLLAASLAALGACLFLLFADPVEQRTQYTSTGPNWEDLGPAFIAAIISLLANLCLIGGAKQYSKEIVLFWIVWKFLLLILFWTWFAYSKLKYHGYIDWMSVQGMRRCYWCSLKEAKYVDYGGTLASIGLVIIIIPVIQFHLKLKRHLREMTQSMSQYDFAPVMYHPSSQQQLQYSPYKY